MKCRERKIPSRWTYTKKFAFNTNGPRALSFDARGKVTCCCWALHNTPNNHFGLCNSFLSLWYMIWVVMVHVFVPWYFNYCRIKRYGSQIDFTLLLVPSQAIISSILWLYFFLGIPKRMQKLNAIWLNEDDTRQSNGFERKLAI